MPDRFSSAGLRLIFIQQIAVVDNDCVDDDGDDDDDDDGDDDGDDGDDARPLCRAADSRLIFFQQIAAGGRLTATVLIFADAIYTIYSMYTFS